MIGVVTGGGTGIGRAIAIELAKGGTAVVVIGRREAPLVETVSMIRKAGGLADYFIGNVIDRSSVRALRGFVSKVYGSPDILVNNAGIDISGPFTELGIEQWDRLIATNLTGPYLCCQEFIPHMIASGRGVVINISSILGIRGIANFSGYAATKAGLRSFSESLAEELQPAGVYVHCICPGRTATDMQIRLGGSRVAELSMSPEEVASIVRTILNGNRRLPVVIVADRRPIKLMLYDWRRLLARFVRRILKIL